MMKKGKRRAENLTALWILVCALGTAAQAPRDGALQAARAVYDRERREIDAGYANATRGAATQYAEELRSVIRHMRQTEDEFGVGPAREELERFERDKTIPDKDALGTPELIKKARERYGERVKGPKAEKQRKLDSLVSRYVNHLALLQRRYESEDREDAARSAAEEIRRVRGAVESESGSSPAVSSLILQSGLLRGISLVYELHLRQSSRLVDLSGRENSGRILGARANENASGGMLFTEYADLLECRQPIPMGGSWTLLFDVHFPLNADGKQRVLASGGFRQDHVMVDGTGELGVGAGPFVGSGYGVRDLKGWHRIVAVGKMDKTLFYVDAKPVGTAGARCREKLAGFGNSTASGYPMHGALRTVAVWARDLSKAEIEALPERLVPE